METAIYGLTVGVEILNDIAATLSEFPLSVQGKKDGQDARRYRFLMEHWPKDWGIGFRSNGKVFIMAQGSALSPKPIIEADTLDAALDAMMPRM
jgi:hypothetical protein